MRLGPQPLVSVYVAASVSLGASVVEHFAWLSPDCNSAAMSKCGRAGVPAPLEHRGRVERLWEVICAVIAAGTLIPKSEAQSKGAE